MGVDSASMQSGRAPARSNQLHLVGVLKVHIYKKFEKK
jgi:hypothetical protein